MMAKEQNVSTDARSTNGSLPAGYRRQFKFSPNFEIPFDTKVVAWDFDGTIADTERLQRVTFMIAAAELTGIQFSSVQWKAGFSKAFGLLEPDTCKEIARVLRREHSAQFQKLLPDDLRLLTAATDGSGATDRTVQDMQVDHVAGQIRARRYEVFDYFLKNSGLISDASAGCGCEVCQLSIDPQTVDDCPKQHQFRRKTLAAITVALQPHVQELLEYFDGLGMLQGIATSSPRNFVQPLLEKFRLTERFSAIVCVEDVPTDQTKPKPYPWLTLMNRLGDQRSSEGGIKPENVLVFENSAGGAVSALRAEMHVIACDVNIPALIGEIDGKLAELSKDSASGIVRSGRGDITCIPSWGRVPRQRPALA